MESKQSMPSVIARLMGLDELPPRQPIHKQQRVLSENYLRKTASIGVREKRSSYESCSFRMNAQEHQKFKDNFEVPSIPKMDKHHNLSVQKEKACSNLIRGNVAFARQKCKEAKHLSTNKKLQHPKQFDDTPEVIDSNKDLLLGYLQEQCSFFAEHLHNVQGFPLSPQSSHAPGLESLNAPTHRKNDIYRRLERRAEQRNALKSFPKFGNGFVTHSCKGLCADNSQNLLKSGLQSEDEKCISPARIVVMKPNLGKTPDTRSLVSPPYKVSETSFRSHKDIHSKNGEIHAEAREKKNLESDMEPFGHGPSREAAKVITEQMKHNTSNIFGKVSRSGFRGDDKSLNDFGVEMPSSPNIFDWKTQHKKSFSDSIGLSVAKEARKQFSERWKMTENYQEVGQASRGNTLGAMLAIVDHERRPSNLDCKHGKDDQFGQFDGDVNLCNPLGISSKDGWKDECVRGFTKSRSLSASSTATGSPKTMTENKALHCDWYMRPEKAVNRELFISRKHNFHLKDSSRPGYSMLSSSRSLSFSFIDSENNCSAQGAYVILSEPKDKVEENDVPEQSIGFPKVMSSSCPCSSSEKAQAFDPQLNYPFEQNSQVPRSSIIDVASKSAVSDTMADSEAEDIGMLSGTTQDLQSEPMTILSVKDGDSASCDLVTSVLQETSVQSPGGSSVSSHCTGTNPESFVSLEEAYQPSPISVLELPFKEEISSGSECFESISTDLHGLQMQLQLLKSESPEVYSEGSGILVSSDEDTEEGSVSLYEENIKPRGLFKARDSMDFSYLVDVLVEAGFHGGNLEMGLETWHSPECPISPLVFERLEKKYCEQTSWKRSERMLLFDRINSGLMEMIWPYTDIPMWVGSVTKRLSFKWSQEVIEEELWKLLLSQEKQASKNFSEKALGKETRWLELADDIAIIGKEIESLLIDELAAEIVRMENFLST